MSPLAAEKAVVQDPLVRYAEEAGWTRLTREALDQVVALVRDYRQAEEAGPTYGPDYGLGAAESSGGSVEEAVGCSASGRASSGS